ncbi:hypothetical protein [Aestuariivirga litoralis]|uniref:hypothetical protein n=1 Tax=Aestuariivirga litoralis TaxID=2650924 RepID=UPI0018C70FB9|nr:hypothetical protein [Aestuariivirga litoralis]MBG1232666.1 hypothetical protein [Aestuariivirga litoralis]
MKKIIMAVAITALTATCAFAQTSNDASKGADDQPLVPMAKADCEAMAKKAHSGNGAWTDAETKPFMDKMMANKMTTKTPGKLTIEEFTTACEAGAFTGM